MAASDYPWSQLPTWTQWEKLAFDSSYNSQAGSPSEFPFDNSLFTDIPNTPSLSPNTTPSPLSNPTTPNSHPQNPSHRQRRTVKPARFESSTTGSALQDASHRPISVCLYPFLLSHPSPPPRPKIKTNHPLATSQIPKPHLPTRLPPTPHRAPLRTPIPRRRSREATRRRKGGEQAISTDDRFASSRRDGGG